MNYQNFNRIEDDSALAEYFNGIMRHMNHMRIFTAPRYLKRDEDIASFQDEQFCDFLRYEIWMHGVVGRLRDWCSVIEEYFTEYDGSWRYYAAAKRMEFIREWGSESQNDFNEDGSIRTEGLSDKCYKPYCIQYDLLTEGRDIVQDTVPDDLRGMFANVVSISKIDIMEGLKKCYGFSPTVYKQTKNGDFHIARQEELDLDKVSRQVAADDDVKRLRAVSGSICSIIQMVKVCKWDDDNTELLQMVSDVSTALLNMDFDTLGLALRKFSDKYSEVIEKKDTEV